MPNTFAWWSLKGPSALELVEGCGRCPAKGSDGFDRLMGGATFRIAVVGSKLRRVSRAKNACNEIL